MKLRSFEEYVSTHTDGDDMDDRLTYDVVALAGEVGEVSSEWKRNAKGSYTPDDFREAILLELGDVFHYTVRVAHDLGLSISDVMDANVEKLENRKKYGKGKHGKRS